ncbi:MAG: hypothetical protein KDA63_12785 [Planctomycetales bacterium]|nr:hypothetical protein [Planctomycetales bacterium]
MQPTRKALLVWLSIYVALALAGCWGAFTARQWVIDRVDNDKGAADWEAWKQDVTQTNERAGTQVRRLPEGQESGEPPSLVLMRDHFAAVLGFGVLIGTLLFAFSAYFLHGALFAPGPPIDAPGEDDRPRV